MASEPAVSDAVAAFATLSDDELVERVKDLAGCERRASVALVRSLMEFDARELYLREGCSSLYTYCTQVLHLSEGAAYNRIEAARAARRYPQVLEMLERGELTLTAVRLLAPHLTPDNHSAVLAAARHKSRFEIQELVASIVPGGACSTQSDAIVITPLAPDSCRLHVTLSRETYDKLLHAQRLLRHTHPTGDVGAILDHALTVLIDDLERRKLARVASPRPAHSEGSASGRHIPAAVRRAVWQRDEGRCTFVGREGRCGETGFLEFHHVEPYATGGAATADNIHLRCRAHNQYEARLFFGDMMLREQPDGWQPQLLSTDRAPPQPRLPDVRYRRRPAYCVPAFARRSRAVVACRASWRRTDGVSFGASHIEMALNELDGSIRGGLSAGAAVRRGPNPATSEDRAAARGPRARSGDHGAPRGRV